MSCINTETHDTEASRCWYLTEICWRNTSSNRWHVETRPVVEGGVIPSPSRKSFKVKTQTLSIFKVFILGRVCSMIDDSDMQTNITETAKQWCLSDFSISSFFSIHEQNYEIVSQTFYWFKYAYCSLCATWASLRQTASQRHVKVTSLLFLKSSMNHQQQDSIIYLHNETDINYTDTQQVQMRLN